MEMRRGPATAVALSLVAILLAALLPSEATLPIPNAEGIGTGVADAARNLVLFVPLGASLAWGRMQSMRAVLVGAVLSTALEASQLALPGREANSLDVLVNGAGTGVGVAMSRSAARWLRPSALGARRLSLLAGVLAAAVFLATGFLFAPATSRSQLACHLPPDFARVRAYERAILGASLDGLELPNGPIRDPERVHARLESDYELRVAAVAAPPAEHTAALLAITTPSREVVFLGVEREDLVFRYLSRGGLLGLETARLRLPGALHRSSVGRPINVRVRRAGGDLCIAVDDTQECSLGLTVGDGWLLLAPGVPEHRTRRVLAALWIASILVPVGYWGAGSRRPGVPWATAGAGLILAPAVTGLLATPVSQLAAGFAGLVAGGSLWRVRDRRGNTSRT